MSLWAVSRHLWPHLLLLPPVLPGWTLHLAHPLTVPGPVHCPCYQPWLCPRVQPPGDGPHEWGYGLCQGHLWSQPACRVGAAAATWQTWKRRATPWQFIGSCSTEGIWFALISTPVSVGNPSGKVTFSWVRWAPPKERSGLEGWILWTLKIMPWFWWLHVDDILVTQPFWSLWKRVELRFYTQMDY